MNCHECDQIWNQILDAETFNGHKVATDVQASSQLLAERVQAACDHTLGCPRCRLVRARYDTLRHALRSWLSKARPELTSSPTLLEELLAEQKTELSRRRRRWSAALRLGAAVAGFACLTTLVLAPLRWRLERDSPANGRGQPASPASETVPRPANRQADSRVLSEALADATAATWNLARTTSGPAARLGRHLLASATHAESPSQPEASAADLAGPSYTGLDSLASVLPAAPQPPPGSALLQQVGDGLSASFRPLSSTARHAFGFLRMPSLEKTYNGAIHQPASKGT